MNTNKIINMLLDYGLENELLKEEDTIYIANRLLRIFKENCFEREKGKAYSLDEILNEIRKIGEKEFGIKTIWEMDIFDTLIMDKLMPRPSEIQKEFENRFNNQLNAMDYFYNLSKSSNYIRMDRIRKNICFKEKSKYGLYDITINLSKPEKDIKDIVRAQTITKLDYPKCPLCLENVGYQGDEKKAPRANHRVVKIKLDDETYYMQYSPYVYYNEHMIVFSEIHRPMVVNEGTFRKLISFVEKFPTYFMGSNAALPIVGGSILSHDHFQGGRYNFPMFSCVNRMKISFLEYDDVTSSYLNWPVDVIRLKSKNRNSIIKLSSKILSSWQTYFDEEHEIYAFTDQMHNAITPIARLCDGIYIVDLALRNNRTDENHKEGIFHPRKDLHHIKKENIGLIEVMGLAVLPGRLNDELSKVKKYLLNDCDINEVDEKHKDFALILKKKYEDVTKDNIESIIKHEISLKYEQVLECCSVMRFGNKCENMNRFIRYVNIQK